MEIDQIKVIYQVTPTRLDYGDASNKINQIDQIKVIHQVPSTQLIKLTYYVSAPIQAN
jgi:hypothetical protein